MYSVQHASGYARRDLATLNMVRYKPFHLYSSTRFQGQNKDDNNAVMNLILVISIMNSIQTHGISPIFFQINTINFQPIAIRREQSKQLNSRPLKHDI